MSSLYVPALCLCTSEDDVEDSQSGKQAELKESGQADKQAVRQTERHTGARAVQRSAHPKQPARLGLQGVSLCSPNNAASSLYFFSMCCPCIHPTMKHTAVKTV